MAEKVLFVRDGPILQNRENGEYFAVHYSNKFIEHYQFFGEEVSFLMRGQNVSKEEGKKYSLISNPSFRHIGIPNFKSIRTLQKRKEAKKIIKEAVDSHDVIITRILSAAGTIAFHYARKIGKPVLVECVARVYDALWNSGFASDIAPIRECLPEESHNLLVKPKQAGGFIRKIEHRITSSFAGHHLDKLRDWSVGMFNAELNFEKFKKN